MADRWRTVLWRKALSNVPVGCRANPLRCVRGRRTEWTVSLTLAVSLPGWRRADTRSFGGVHPERSRRAQDLLQTTGLAGIFGRTEGEPDVARSQYRE